MKTWLTTQYQKIHILCEQFNFCGSCILDKILSNNPQKREIFAVDLGCWINWQAEELIDKGIF